MTASNTDLFDGAEVCASFAMAFGWTDRYLMMRTAGEPAARLAFLDAEAIVQDEQGRSELAAFRQTLASRPEDPVLMGL
jgi:hypothetical protein